VGCPKPCTGLPQVIKGLPTGAIPMTLQIPFFVPIDGMRKYPAFLYIVKDLTENRIFCTIYMIDYYLEALKLDGLIENFHAVNQTIASSKGPMEAGDALHWCLTTIYRKEIEHYKLSVQASQRLLNKLATGATLEEIVKS
jgi:hypothetical protein